MVSTASTVTEFCMPDTVSLVQWPLIVIVLDTPLTVTLLPLQVTILFSLMPAMLILLPGAGAADVDGPAVGVLLLLVDGVGLRGALRGELNTEVFGVEGSTMTLLLEIRCATYAAMPPTTASMPTTKTAARIQNTRLPEDRRGPPERGAPGKGAP